ncbi:uncharacterized protein LOC105685995 [Athalia rosae]|uniref:uncharacterized protein LOC105685995 n=1 Tax=Athalia rosae TaxID=37344 RepID=UPI002034A42F|nr:uncharacterized protein LOC105685995 [Athalia rosae]
MAFISPALFFLIINSISLLVPLHGAEISSKIDLDDEETTPPPTLSAPVLKAYVDINQPGVVNVAKPARTSSKQPSRGFMRQSVRRPLNEHRNVDEEINDENEDYISIDDLFKAKRQQLHQNPIGSSPLIPNNVQGFYGESDAKPTIINNIHVTINANESSAAGVNGCKNGVCDVRVSSKPDAEGNVITNVHLSVVTKLKKPPIVADVPIIEGTVGFRRQDFDQLPAFHFTDHNVRYGGSFFDNNIPQIPIHRQDVDSWYHQQPAIFERARPVWHYGRNLDRGFKDNPSRPSQGHRRSWTESRNREIIDDKIEAPLSKTKPADEQE